MNREDIIRMAREAGFDYSGAELSWESVICTEELERFAALVASAEREACAEICKKHADFYAGLEPSPIAQSAWAACVDNRDTIRARGQE
jgi:hypothetical protein